MDYIVKRNLRQKNLRMHFNDKGQLIVSSPYFIDEKTILSFVEKNKSWIDKQLAKYKERFYISGEIFPFFGKDYNLVVSEGKRSSVCISDNSLLVVVTNALDSEKVRKAILGFYKKMLLVFVTERISYWQKIMGFKDVNVKISNAKTTWGVCYSTKNLIKFSAMTAMLNEELIDMIVVHELCHLKFQNHSTRFWNEVNKYVPDLDRKKKELKVISKSGVNRNLF